MIEILNKKRKMTFVDVDGVLSAPKFGRAGIGMPEETWFRYCIEYGDSAYDECGRVPCVAERLKKEAEDAELYVLTAVGTSFEADAKRKFVREKYPDVPFDGFIAVGSSKDKIKAILAMADSKRILPGDCEIIEDDYPTLLECAAAGINATHLANVAADSVSKS